MMSDKNAPPWVTAGVPRGDWLKVLGYAAHQMVEADEAVKGYATSRTEAWDFKRFAELQAAAKQARQRWEAVLAGDAHTVGILFPEVGRAESEDLPDANIKEIGSDRR